MGWVWLQAALPLGIIAGMLCVMGNAQFYIHKAAHGRVRFSLICLFFIFLLRSKTLLFFLFLFVFCFFHFVFFQISAAEARR